MHTVSEKTKWKSDAAVTVNGKAFADGRNGVYLGMCMCMCMYSGSVVWCIVGGVVWRLRMGGTVSIWVRVCSVGE
jgi:hypothetical protein